MLNDKGQGAVQVSRRASRRMPDLFLSVQSCCRHGPAPNEPPKTEREEKDNATAHCRKVGRSGQCFSKLGSREMC